MIKGLATGIGSLPYRDADAAVDFVFKYLPNIPFWPQLPKRDIREGMVAQYSENLPCIKVTADGFFWDNSDIEKDLEVFYSRIISGDADYFKISRSYAEGLYSFYDKLNSSDLKSVEFIKCHITGPFTFAAGINNQEGVSILHDQVFMQVVTKALAMKAQWQINLFRKFGKKLILFIDEPYLGCFGSAYTPISRESVVQRLGELISAVRADDVLIGVHCCGNTDWSIFVDVPGIDIINFDAFGFTDKLVLYAGELKDFFKRGGILCWGIVPTQEISDSLKPEYLLGKIEDGIKILVKKGVDGDLVRNNLLLSPSCGLGTLDETKAAKVFSLLAKISASLRNL
jgi:methionine synthase II (cobalamin-independent)